VLSLRLTHGPRCVFESNVRDSKRRGKKGLTSGGAPGMILLNNRSVVDRMKSSLNEQTEVVRPPTLTEVVAGAIRKRIFTGMLPQGQALPEVPLSENLGVSRGTVREALRYLKDEKLVAIYPHRGAFVASLSAKQLDELYSIRSLIEPFATRLAVENGYYTPNLIDYMRTQIAIMAKAEKDHEHLVNIQADFEFHLSVCRGSRHELLIAFEESLRSLTYLAVYNMIIYESEPTDAAQQHTEILESICNDTPADAAETVRRHLEDSKTMLLNRWEALGEHNHHKSRNG